MCKKAFLFFVHAMEGMPCQMRFCVLDFFSDFLSVISIFPITPCLIFFIISFFSLLKYKNLALFYFFWILCGVSSSKKVMKRAIPIFAELPRIFYFRIPLLHASNKFKLPRLQIHTDRFGIQLFSRQQLAFCGIFTCDAYVFCHTCWWIAYNECSRSFVVVCTDFHRRMRADRSCIFLPERQECAWGCFYFVKHFPNMWGNISWPKSYFLPSASTTIPSSVS